MKRSRIVTLYRRELRDVLRDRRTLFTMLVLPVILYPAMMLGFTKLTVSRTEELFRQEFAVDLRLAGRPLLRGGGETDELAAAVLGVERFRLVSTGDPKEAVRTGGVDLAVDLPAGSGAALAEGRQIAIVPFHRSADEDSSAALRLFTQAVERWRDRKWPLRIAAADGDQSSGSERSGRLFGGMLAMMVVMMAMTGAFYPALDVAAGEKERGTLETLLLSPATRRELVLGKYLTVLTVAVVAALMNLASLSFTIGGFSSVIGAARGQQMPFTIGPEAFVIILVGLLITAALFAAVCLALSTFARSYKEGQTYLTPALLLVMPLSMTALLPNMKLDPGLAAVPIANLALLMKEVLSGRFPGVETAITLGTLLLLALAALQWTVALFEREDVLFREGRQVFALRPPKGLPRPTRPPLGVALLGLVAALAWMYQAGTRVAGSAPWVQIVVTMAGLAAIAVGLPMLAMVRLPAGLDLSPPWSPGYLTGALVGLGALLVSTAVFRAQSVLLGEPDPALGEMLGGVLADSTPLALVLLALLPALAEELLFRGLLLQGFRGVARDGVAILLSAVAFGLFHLLGPPDASADDGGVAFGVLAVRAGSILPAMVAHAVHNGLAVLAAAGVLVPLAELLDGAPASALFLGGAAVIVAASKLTRARSGSGRGRLMLRLAGVLLVLAALVWAGGHLVLPAGPPAFMFPLLLAANAAFAIRAALGSGLGGDRIAFGLVFLAVPVSAPLALCHLVAASVRARVRDAAPDGEGTEDLRILGRRWLALGNVATAMAVIWGYLVVVPWLARASSKSFDVYRDLYLVLYRDPLARGGSGEGLAFAAVAILATLRLARELLLTVRVLAAGRVTG